MKPTKDPRVQIFKCYEAGTSVTVYMPKLQKQERGFKYTSTRLAYNPGHVITGKYVLKKSRETLEVKMTPADVITFQ